MPSLPEPSNPRSSDADLDVGCAVPSGLSGRLTGIDRDGVVHSVQVGHGRVTYSCCRVRTETDLNSLVVFGGSTLVFGDASPVYELRTGSGTLRRVDLAGHGRALAAPPTPDPATGELHLVALDPDGLQAHVVVSAGGLMRRSRPILGAPGRIRALALSGDHVVLVADGFVSVSPREGEMRTTWIATGIAAPHVVRAYDTTDAVVVLALTPSLERWTLHPAAGDVQRDVLDPTPRVFAHCDDNGVDGAPRCLWTTDGGTISRHDLVGGRHTRRSVRGWVPGDFAFVADAARGGGAEGGWLVGLIHSPSGRATRLCVIDATDVLGPAITTVPIAGLVEPGLRLTWNPSTAH